MIDVCRQKADFSEKKTIIMQECKHTSGFHMHQMYKIHLERHGIKTQKGPNHLHNVFRNKEKLCFGLEKGSEVYFFCEC